MGGGVFESWTRQRIVLITVNRINVLIFIISRPRVYSAAMPFNFFFPKCCPYSSN